MTRTSLDGTELLFLHIPKTAGSSFTRILKALYPEERIFHQMDPLDLIALLERGEHHHQLYIGHYYYDVLKKFPVEPRVLTFLREPRQRVISHYYFYRKQSDEAVAAMPDRDKRIVELTRQYGFADFISLDLPEVEQAFANAQTRHLASCTDYPVPQDRWRRAMLVRQARRHLGEMAFVGIAEEFDRSLALFRREFDIVADIEPVAVNVNEERPDGDGDLEIFATNPIARRRVELDMALYDTGLNIFRRALDPPPPWKTRVVSWLARHPAGQRFIHHYERLRRR